MKILNLLTSGGIGGIEVLCRDIASYSDIENEFAFLFGGGAIYDYMKQSKNIVHDLDDGKKITVKRFEKLIQVAKKADVVVVHHSDPFLELYYIFLKLRFPNKKFVSMIHHCYEPKEQGYGRIKNGIRNHILKQMICCSDKMIFVSKAGYNSFSPYFDMDSQKIEIIYNGISKSLLDLGAACKKNVYKLEVVQIYYIGRLVHLKGVDMLIKAIAELSKRYAVHLVCVGDGTDRAKTEELVQKLNIVGDVDFVGFQSDVTSYLEKADLFVYPSRTEIFGISLVEAMAFGNICVANNVGGIPEIIRDGVNGFLNLANDVEGLEQTLEKAIQLLNETDKAEKMRSMAKKTAATFGIDTTIRKLEKVYMELKIDEKKSFGDSPTSR